MRLLIWKKIEKFEISFKTKNIVKSHNNTFRKYDNVLIRRKKSLLEEKSHNLK